MFTKAHHQTKLNQLNPVHSFTPYFFKVQFNIIHFHLVEFEVLMAASKKMAVFWVVAPCSLAASIISVIITLMMEAASTSETLVNFYQTARHYNPEDSNLHST
jgi:hypothetical protein